jgi:hypothetical protein
VKHVWVVPLFALVTMAATDAFLHRWLPFPPPRKEMEDGVREYAGGDPTVLVIGSSHARSFDSIGALVARRQPGGHRLVAVPVEFGKLASYEWVLNNRIWPLADEKTSDGSPRRQSLRKVILITEWWDSCDTEGGQPSINLPARAWDLSDFLEDFRRHGLTTYNRNYLRNRWSRLFQRSYLVRDRGHETILPRGLNNLRGRPEGMQAAEYDAQVASWRRMVEEGVSCIGSPIQLAALDRMLAEFAHRDLDVTILLYPRKPATLSATARETTLAQFGALVAERATRWQARVIDFTTSSPLRDDEFADDFDHVTPAGNQRFAAWALDGALGWLLELPQGGSDGAPAP